MIRRVAFLTALILAGALARAQEYPEAELGLNYSYARYGPSANFTSGHSVNGGGGSAVYNFSKYFGIAADLQGYASNTSHFSFQPNTFFPRGFVANVQGNLFTYLFGPQVKFRFPGIEPLAHLLIGGAHSNVYGELFKQCTLGLQVCAFGKNPDGNGFAMAVGGGFDIPIGHRFSVRPGTFDYLLTNFSNHFNNGHQNNFRYTAGLNFNIGGSASQ